MEETRRRKMFLFVVRTSHLERKHIFLGCFLCVCTRVSKNKKKKQTQKFTSANFGIEISPVTSTFHINWYDHIACVCRDQVIIKLLQISARNRKKKHYKRKKTNQKSRCTLSLCPALLWFESALFSIQTPQAQPPPTHTTCNRISGKTPKLVHVLTTLVHVGSFRAQDSESKHQHALTELMTWYLLRYQTKQYRSSDAIGWFYSPASTRNLHAEKADPRWA